MKYKKLKQIIICTLICTSIGVSVKSTKVKAMSFNEVYQNTYNTVINLQKLGESYYITPRNSHNGSKMADNRLEDTVNCVNQIQPIIDKLRNYQHQFPNKYWKSRNTFSEIGDGYQQPIYEWIVDIAIRNNKKLDNLNNFSKDELYKSILNIQKEISSGIILNKGVDIAYRKAYQVALENDQEKLDKFIEKNKDKEKLKYAQYLGKIIGLDTNGQIKQGNDLSKKLNQKEDLDYSIETFGANPFRDEENFITKIEDGRMSENQKVILSHIMALNAKQTLNYCGDKSRYSLLYGFTQSAIIEEPKLLKEVKNPINRDFIKINLDDIKEINKHIEDKYPKNELTTAEDYMAPARSRYVSFFIYPIGMDFYYISDIKRITNSNDFPKVFSEIPSGEKYYERLIKPSVKGDLLSGPVVGNGYVSRCHSDNPPEKLDKIYYNYTEGVIYYVGKDYISIYDMKKDDGDNRDVGKATLSYNIKTKEVSIPKKSEPVKKTEVKKPKLVLNKDGVKAIDNFDKLKEKAQQSLNLTDFKVADDYLYELKKNSIKFGISEDKLYNMATSLEPTAKKILTNIKDLRDLKDFKENCGLYINRTETKECFEKICSEVSKEAKNMKNLENVKKVTKKIMNLDAFRLSNMPGVSESTSKNYVTLVTNFTDKTYSLYKDGVITKEDAKNNLSMVFSGCVHGFDSNFFHVQGVLNKVEF